MTTIRTLLLKDLRRFLPHCIAATALMLLYLSSGRLDRISDTALIKTAIHLLLPAMFGAWMLLVSFVVHDAPLTGTTEFWPTRPISGAQLFAEKFITLALYFVLIPSIAHIAARATGLIPFNADTSGSFAKIAIGGWLIFTLFMMLLASLTRNTAQFVFCVVALLICFMVSIFSFDNYPFDPPPKTALQNPRLFDMIIPTVTITGLISIIYNQYVRRNRIITIAATLLLWLLLTGIWKLWPLVPAK